RLPAAGLVRRHRVRVGSRAVDVQRVAVGTGRRCVYSTSANQSTDGESYLRYTFCTVVSSIAVSVRTSGVGSASVGMSPSAVGASGMAVFWHLRRRQRDFLRTARSPHRVLATGTDDKPIPQVRSSVGAVAKSPSFRNIV